MSYKGIYSGDINHTNLPVEVYETTALKLLKGIEEGADVNYINFEFGKLGERTALALRENVYLFSAAKTFNYVLSTENLILGADGQIIPFKQFEELAKANNALYNKTWLEVEYNSAQIQASNIVDFKDFQSSKSTFPFLKYVTFKDKNVSEICRRLEGVVMATDSTFWHTHSPQQHYQCRCRLEPMTDGAETKLSTKNLIKPNPLFKNPAITEQIFNKNHPYFNIDAKYKAFAKTNFGLNIPPLKAYPIKSAPIKEPITNKDIVKGEAEKFTGTKLNEKAFKFVNDDLKVVNGGGSVSQDNKKISFGSIKDDDYCRLRTVYHELGHSTHLSLKQCYLEKEKMVYSKEYADLLTLSKNELKTLDVNKILNKIDLDNYYEWNRTKTISTGMQDKMSVKDTICDLMKGVKGVDGGHTQKYYKQLHGMETFAHLNENYFIGNNIFKEYLPKTYEAGLKYLKNLYGE